MAGVNMRATVECGVERIELAQVLCVLCRVVPVTLPLQLHDGTTLCNRGLIGKAGPIHRASVRIDGDHRGSSRHAVSGIEAIDSLGFRRHEVALHIGGLILCTLSPASTAVAGSRSQPASALEINIARTGTASC